METEPQATNDTAVPPAMPAEGITVEFVFASSPAFEHALEVAKRNPTCTQTGEGKNLRVRVAYQWTNLSALQEFRNASWDLHNKKCWINGQEVPWDAMAKLTWCFQALTENPRHDHCFFDYNFVNPWGCRYARATLDAHINAAWLRHGHFEQDTYILNKGKIREQIWAEIRSGGFLHCPAFDAEFMDRMLDTFPERINVNHDNRWKIQRDGRGTMTHVAAQDVPNAWKIVRELQAKIREERGCVHTQENGKKEIPACYFPRREAPPKKKGLLAKVLGK